MRYRRLGRTGHDSSVLIYGAASLSDVTQETADASIQQALDAGINHFDVAASYGDAELRLGPWIPRIRSDIFLASKTGDRDTETAWASINHSLERLQTDHLDLIQMHGVTDMHELDLVTGENGSLKAAIRARDEGMVSWIGITGHGHEAPAVHLEGLHRFDFDSVLTPLNYCLYQRPEYAAAFDALVAETTRVDAALMVIKTIARRNWPDGAQHLATWYEPWTEQKAIDAAVAWNLAQPGITGLATAGEVSLLGAMIEAESRAAQISVSDAATVLDQLPDYSSPFEDMPI